MTDRPVGIHEVEQITPVPIVQGLPQAITGVPGIESPDTIEEQLRILIFDGTSQNRITRQYGRNRNKLPRRKRTGY